MSYLSDIDECAASSCNVVVSTCENTVGSFICHCKTGYEKVGGACVGQYQINSNYSKLGSNFVVLTFNYRGQ